MRKGLIAFTCLSSLAGPIWAEGGKTYALVVGVDNYLNPNVPKLRYAVSDANIFAQALKQTLKVPDSQLFLLTSDSADDKNHPRATNIAAQLVWLNSHVKREDTIIFYFAGHGITLDKQPYLLTEESDNSSSLALGVSSLPGTVLMDYLSKVKAANVWLVLDACRNSGSREPNSLGDIGFTRTDVGQDRTATMFSCKIGERSWESDEFKHGFYTYYLVAGLREKAVDDKGELNLQGLSDYVGKEVPAAVTKLGQKQTPWLSYGGGDRWVLAQGLPHSAPKTAKADTELAQWVAKLDMKQAELDKETALRMAAEARAQMLEGKRVELEQRLAILEKKLGLKSNETAQASEPNTLAYAGRDAKPDQGALESENSRLKKENAALNERLNQLQGNLAKDGVASREAFILKDEMVQAGEQVDAKADLPSQFERYLELGENALSQYEKAAAPVVAKRQISGEEAKQVGALEKKLKGTHATNEVLRSRLMVATTRVETLQARVKLLEAKVGVLQAQLDEKSAELAKMKTDLQKLQAAADREQTKLDNVAVNNASMQDELNKWRDNHPDEFEPRRSGRNPWEYQAVQRMPYLLQLEVPEAQYFPAKNKP